MAAIDRGKEIIKEAIRATQPGKSARIPVADEANFVVFQQALRAKDVKRLLIQKGVSVEFYFPEAPVEQAKKAMLQVIRSASAEIQEIVFPVLAQDYADAEIALASSEVQLALSRRGITASLRREFQKQQIVIASIVQAMNDELDRYLKERE